MTQSYCRHKVASLNVGRVMQSRDWRLLIAQVQREARELPVKTSIDKLAKVIGEKLKFVGEENQYRTWESGGRNKA